MTSIIVIFQVKVQKPLAITLKEVMAEETLSAVLPANLVVEEEVAMDLPKPSTTTLFLAVESEEVQASEPESTPEDSNMLPL